jgi:hypothetical protein
METTTCTCGCGTLTTLTEAAEPCTCGCECCAPPDSPDEERARLRDLRARIDARLEQLGDRV